MRNYLFGIDGLGYYVAFFVEGLDDRGDVRCLFCFREPLEYDFKPYDGCLGLIEDKEIVIERETSLREIKLQVCGSDERSIRLTKTSSFEYPLANIGQIGSILRNKNYRLS